MILWTLSEQKEQFRQVVDEFTIKRDSERAARANERTARERAVNAAK